jgi:RNA polymerase sigma-70 factor (ECF subfamily)
MGAMQVLELNRDGSKASGANGHPETTEGGEPLSGMDRARSGDAGKGDDGWDIRFAVLAEEHGRLLFRIAHGLLRNAHDAEDAVQEALLRMYRAGLRDGSGAEIGDEKAYLARTVWHAGLDIAARRPKRTEPLEGTGPMEGNGAVREFAAAGRSAEEELAAGDERALLRILIDALPEELRQPLMLSAIEEMTSREVAAAMGIPEGTVRTRVMRARAELRRRFGAMQARAKSNHGFSRTDTDRA